MSIFSKKKYSEDELLSGCATNDRRAQEALYRIYFPEMFRMCRRYTTDDDTAMDITNTGFLRVFKKIHLFGQKGSLEGWIRRVIYHCMADHFKKNAQYKHFLNLDDHDQSVPERGLDTLFEADILSAVRMLPPVSQEVFRLFALEGYSHAEIAINLQISEGTSKWHLSNARQKLRDLIAPDGEIKHKKNDKLNRKSDARPL